MHKPTLGLCLALGLSGAVATAQTNTGEDNLDLSQIISSMSGQLPQGMPKPAGGLPD